MPFCSLWIWLLDNTDVAFCWVKIICQVLRLPELATCLDFPDVLLLSTFMVPWCFCPPCSLWLRSPLSTLIILQSHLEVHSSKLLPGEVNSSCSFVLHLVIIAPTPPCHSPPPAVLWAPTGKETWDLPCTWCVMLRGRIFSKASTFALITDCYHHPLRWEGRYLYPYAHYKWTSNSKKFIDLFKVK